MSFKLQLLRSSFTITTIFLLVFSPLLSVTPVLATEATATDSAQTVVVSIDNQASISAQINDIATTGDNIASSAAELKTATASAATIVDNQVNTTLIGNQQHFEVINVTQTPTTDLHLGRQSVIHSTPEATRSAATQSIAITNQADVVNTVTQVATTGNNTLVSTQPASSSAEMTTAPATVSAQVVNVANTTLLGDCWYAAIVNILVPVEDNILLPNEEDYLHCEHQDSLGLDTANHSKEIVIRNEADSETFVTQLGMTGNNHVLGSGELTTGNSDISNQVIDRANSAREGSNWGLIRITNPHYLLHEVSLPNAEKIIDNNILYLWWPAIPSLEALKNSTDVVGPKIKINNQASLKNFLTQTAITGNNTMGSADVGTLKTGDATVTSKIVNYLNTTVVGNNWFWVDINLLSPFTGSIATAKPDLSVTPRQSLLEVRPGQQQVVTFTIVNYGTSVARGSQLNFAVPETIKIIDSNGTHTTTTAAWQIPELKPQQSYSASSLLEINLPAETQVVVTARLSYSLTETQSDNNQTQVILKVIRPPQLKANPTTMVTQQPILPTAPALKPSAPKYVSNPGQVLGQSTVHGLGYSLVPPAFAAESTSATSTTNFCDQNLRFCQGLRLAVWGLGLSGVFLGYRRLRKNIYFPRNY